MTTDAWGGDLPDVQVRDVGQQVSSGYSPEVGMVAWTDTVAALGDLNEAARALDRSMLHGVQYQIERLGGAHVVALTAALQDVRRALARSESLLARAVGLDEATQRDGVLPDGRQYEVRRGASRKAWEHDAWKHDVRAQVLSGVGEVVDTGTGEQVDLHALLAAVQQVHGSAGPKVTALRALGLEVDAYCEVVPGLWGVRVQGDTPDDD